MARQPSEKASARDVAISLDRGCLVRGGRDVALRAKTFQVLAFLHEHHGRLVTKEELFRAVWPDTFVSDDSLTKCIGEIRQALGDDDRRMLKTVARRGFILDVPLERLQQAREAAPSPPRQPFERGRHNLPAAVTSFVGRQREIAELTRLLSAARLLTLMGAGGCGKTRLALEVARQAVDGFPDGVWLADLTPLDDPSLVAHTVAAALDVRQAPGRTMVESLADQLRHRRLLLLLDNCEHVIVSAAQLASALLPAAAGLTILTTSREALGIDGETTWRVPSLTMPGPQDLDRSHDLLRFEAIQLLAERAAAAGSSFAVTKGNAATVTDVCRRLDGIPLAIELAAVRLKVLSIEQLGARLDDRFRLLTATGRTRIGRQRTLEATVDWSYELLTDAERQLLQRLSAFAGGWTLDAAEHVCAGDGVDRDAVLDLMTRLVDKSLVMIDGEADGRRRYRFLETVRHYARERLRQSGEGDAVRARHFGFFLELAREAEPELIRAEQVVWLGRLQIEHDNLRAALEWRLSSEHHGAGVLELAAALHWFWLKRAHFAEGQHSLERALARNPQAAAELRAQALMALGSIVFFQGDFERANRLFDESTVLADTVRAHRIVAVARGLQTMAAMERGDGEAAARCAAESGAAGRAAGEPWLESFSITHAAYAALYAGNVDRAGALHEQLLALFRAQGESWALGIVLTDLGILRVVQQRHAEARALAREGIALARQFGDRRAAAWCLGVQAGADAAEGHWERAARLRGAMEGLLESIGSAVQPTYHALIGDRLFPAVQQALGAEACQQALAAGRAMSLAQAIEYATEGPRR